MVKSKFYNLDTDVTLSSNSDYYVPSEKAVKAYVTTAASGKQDTLVSGTNIKTINNTSILGSGNIDIQADVEAFTAAEVQIIWNGVL